MPGLRRDVKRRLAQGLALASAVTALAGAASAQACRQALLLGLDVSLSVDPNEFFLQRAGLAKALTAPSVMEAILPRAGTHVELAVFEWSGPFDQTLLADWTVIDSPATLHALAQSLVDKPQQARLGKTGLGAAMRFGRDMLLARAGCDQLTLDLSGDGISNSGPLPEHVQPELEAAGIVVNGLVIGIAPSTTGSGEVDVGQLAHYYHDKVIVGTAAFVEAVIGFDDYHAAMTRKLLRELTPSYVLRAPVGRLDPPRLALLPQRQSGPRGD